MQKFHNSRGAARLDVKGIEDIIDLRSCFSWPVNARMYRQFLYLFFTDSKRVLLQALGHENPFTLCFACIKFKPCIKFNLPYNVTNLSPPPLKNYILTM